MKRIILFASLFLALTAKAQFTGTDSLRNFNNRFIDNNASKAFTNLRLHNLLGGIIDFLDTAMNGGSSVFLGVDTMYVTADSVFHYKKNGVFRSFVIRGNPGARNIYEIPFSNGAGRFGADSNFKFDQSQGLNNTRLIVGPVGITDGGLSKLNVTNDNMNGIAITGLANGAASIVFRKAKGTVNSPLRIDSSTAIWTFSGRGYTGSVYTGSRVEIIARATQNWTDTTQGTALYFNVTPRDSSTMRTRMIISDSLQLSAVIGTLGDSVAMLRRNANGLYTILVVPKTALYQRFGIEDNFSEVDRYIDMDGHDFMVDNSSDISLFSAVSGNLSSLVMNGNSATLRTRNPSNISTNLVTSYDHLKLTRSSSTLPGKLVVNATDSLKVDIPTKIAVWDNDTLKMALPSSVGEIPIDVFLIAGQSNAVGQGDSALSPKVFPGAIFQMNTGVLTAANDPIGVNIGTTENASNTGSAWPSFGNSYYNLTSRKVCFIPSAYNGSSQSASAGTPNGNWDTTGVLFDSAVARTQSAISKLTLLGYKPIFKGVLWCQGESDGIGINNSAMTQQDYYDAFKKMIRRFRQALGSSTPFYIFRIGTYVGQPPAGYAQVRQSQQQIADNDSLTRIIYYNALDFPGRSLMKVDNVHYTQVGLNEMGVMGAMGILNSSKNIWQPQDSSIYYPNGRVGIRVSRPQFTLDVNGSIAGDTIYGGDQPGDSLFIRGTKSSSFAGGSAGRIFLGDSSCFIQQPGSVSNDRIGIGTRNPDFGVEIHIKKNENAGHGIKLQNTYPGNGAIMSQAWFNDAGFVGQLYASSSVSTTFGSSVFCLSSSNNILRLVSNNKDIMFARSNAFSTLPFLSLKGGTNNFLYNGTTDNASLGKFQIYSTSYFDSVIKVYHMPAPSGAYNLVVHDGVDSGFKQLPVSAITPVTLYSGDGSVASDRTITGASHDMTYNDIDYFKINSNIFALDKASATAPYSFGVIGPGNKLQIAYTPTTGAYTKSVGITIDTNNNVSIGDGFITSAHPLYTETSAFVSGFTSARGNFLRCDSISTNVTLTLQQYFFMVDATAGNITITLPAASTAFGSGVGIEYVFKRIDATGNTVTIQVNGTPGTDTIDGAGSTTLTGANSKAQLQCASASKWFIK